MSIEEAVQEALEHVNDPPPNESNTCDWIILPLLHAAGYARRDITSRLADNNGQFPDYTVLRDDPLHTWFVEAKAWNVILKANHAQQALNYANQNGKRWVVLTNGQVWQLYDNSVQGLAEAKQVLQVRLKHVEAITEFLKAIGKQSVCSNQLEPTVYAIKQRQEIEAAQAEANRVQTEAIQPTRYSSRRSVPSTKVEVNGNDKEHLNKFWRMFRERLKSKTLTIDDHKPEWANFWFVVNKRQGIDWYYYVAEKHRIKVEYVLDKPRVHQRIAQYLHNHQVEVEDGVGAKLQWMSDTAGEKYIIRLHVGSASFTCEEEQWPAVQEEMISKMLLLQKVLAPFIKAAEAG